MEPILPSELSRKSATPTKPAGTTPIRFSLSLDKIPLFRTDLLFENKRFAPFLVDKRELNRKLSEIDKQTPGSKKAKELEGAFLNAINEEVKKVNATVTKALLEIEDSLRFLGRKAQTLKYGDSSESQVELFNGECDSLLFDIVQLEQYAGICNSQLRQLMIRNDLVIGAHSSTWFETRLNEEAFNLIPFYELLLKVSSLVVKPPWNSSLTPRKDTNPTVKNFFVRPKDLIKVQAWLLRHTNQDTLKKILQEERSHFVSSIYLDSNDFRVYDNFLHTVSGSTLVRVTWNGEEREESHLTFQYQSGLVEHIPIPYRFIDGFLKQEWSYADYVDKKVASGKLEKEKGEKQKAAAEKYLVECTDHKLQSVMRVKAWRDELHYSTTGHVRLDTAIELAKETPGQNTWLKENKGEGGRLIQVPVTILKTTFQDEIPHWFQSLLVSQLLNEVPNNSHPFDLYLYGVTKMYPTKVNITPAWLDSFRAITHPLRADSNLFKSGPSYESDYGTTFETSSSSEAEAEMDEFELYESKGADRPKKERGGYRDLVANEKKELNERASLSLNTKEKDFSAVADAKKKMEENTKAFNSGYQAIPIAEEGKGPSKGASLFSAGASLMDEILPSRATLNVQPKTFFSNERTLLEWINIVVLLATISVALMGLGDRNSRISGLALLPVAVIFGIYAIVMYHLRLKSISEKSTFYRFVFEDNIGPYALVIVFLAVLILSGVIPLLATATFRNNYPIIPAVTPFPADTVKMDSPLNIAPFNANNADRSAAFASLVATLTANQYVFIDQNSAQTKVFKNTHYITGTPTDAHFTAYSRTEIVAPAAMRAHAAAKPENDLIFRLHSTLPGFYALKSLPQVSFASTGTNNNIIHLDCAKSHFYSEATVFSFPAGTALPTLSRLNDFVANVITDLGLPFDTPLTVDNTASNYTLIWTANAALSGSLAQIMVEIDYTNDPTNVTLPTTGTMGTLSFIYPHAPSVQKSLLFTRDIIANFMPTQSYPTCPTTNARAARFGQSPDESEHATESNM